LPTRDDCANHAPRPPARLPTVRPANIPILDPSAGDAEDDASSTSGRSLLSLAGTLLAEISLPKLIGAWLLLVAFPGLLLGIAPLLATIWFRAVTAHIASGLYGVAPFVLLALLALSGWLGGRRVLRLAEEGFWSLNGLVVQPVYAFCREVLRHLAELLLPAGIGDDRRATMRAVAAGFAGVIVCAFGVWVASLAWPAAHWDATLADLAAPKHLALVALANATVVVSLYLAAAGLVWGVGDATMPQPRDLHAFDTSETTTRRWRIAHLSDIHTVGERYGFRIESGRNGPRGNTRLRDVFARLDAIHAAQPLDVVLITGDLTDAGRAAEWAEFFDALAPYPRIAERLVALPGNHDVNVVDRANPARLDLPGSPRKRLRQMRTLSALETLQGARMRLIDTGARGLGGTLSSAMATHRAAIAAFADKGSWGLSRPLAARWEQAFPMVLPPATADGLGIVVLNSNAETHFSFTNALGLVPLAQVQAVEAALARYPDAHWIIAMHHHLVEYPQPAKQLSERIGTALVNGSWLVRRLQRLAGRAVVMHGHRHIDWIGRCGSLPVVSAPSPVMGATDDRDTWFYIHTLTAGADRRLMLRKPERITLPGRPGRLVRSVAAEELGDPSARRMLLAQGDAGEHDRHADERPADAPQERPEEHREQHGERR
jgi:3',5'-cyclic AMP phosphodiesterase CpdA